MIMKFHGSLPMTSLDLLERREGHLIGTKKSHILNLLPSKETTWPHFGYQRVNFLVP